MTIEDLSGELFSAVYEGDDAVVRALRAGAPAETADEDGTTALYLAASHDRPGTVRLLLAAGADPNRGSGEQGDELPLCGAAVWGYTGVLRALLEAGARPDLREHDDGPTALVWACRGGRYAAVEELLEAGADPDLPGPGGEPPLVTAARRGSPSCVRALLRYGARARTEALAEARRWIGRDVERELREGLRASSGDGDGDRDAYEVVARRVEEDGGVTVIVEEFHENHVSGNEQQTGHAAIATLLEVELDIRTPFDELAGRALRCGDPEQDDWQEAVAALWQRADEETLRAALALCGHADPLHQIFAADVLAGLGPAAPHDGGGAGPGNLPSAAPVEDRPEPGPPPATADDHGARPTGLAPDDHGALPTGPAPDERAAATGPSGHEPGTATDGANTGGAPAERPSGRAAGVKGPAAAGPAPGTGAEGPARTQSPAEADSPAGEESPAAAGGSPGTAAEGPTEAERPARAEGPAAGEGAVVPGAPGVEGPAGMRGVWGLVGGESPSVGGSRGVGQAAAREGAVVADTATRAGLSARAVPALRELAREAVHPEVVRAAVLGLGQQADPAALPEILRHAAHPDPGVRHAVAQALGGLVPGGHTEAIRVLIELSRDSEEPVRDWATTALAGVDADTPEIRQALAARLDDTDEDIDAEAARGLAMRQDPRAVEVLARLLADARPEGYAYDTARQALEYIEDERVRRRLEATAPRSR
ncbi:ankyrin repeat domain-containing protein [Streptomyces sp. NPDC000410]|uniref:ankyrin repeat domain-containing protein n=1 Tax=Streptomyces sp. NPDC000410 TaxID=3154254 RepID=UPI00331CC180